ncbi:hypothetical protein BC940DRAFT_295702 [Gongronella butleri]|nr:hypothetical protein BC940DRAFT_295702 [Gongronella butleri]
MTTPAMSISQMMDPRGSSTLSAKVKVFYSFKDDDSTCLCSFETGIRQPSSSRWAPVSLRQCLLTVCSSSPDQLMRQDDDVAIYSANVEESAVSPDASVKELRSTAIWEGHGLLSNLLRDSAHSDTSVTGQILNSVPGDRHQLTIQVILQLHPVRTKSGTLAPGMHPRSSPPPVPPPHQSHRASSTSPSPPVPAQAQGRSPPQPHQPPHQQQQGPRSLPPMRSLLTPDRPLESKLPSIRSLDQPLRSEMDFVRPSTSPPTMSTSSSTGGFDSSVSSSSSDWSRSMLTAPHPYDHERAAAAASGVGAYSVPPTASASHAAPHPYYHHHHPHPHHVPPRYPMASSSAAAASGSTSSPPMMPGADQMAATRKQPMDAFYHQSRRKKRDTKPPNANDVRPYVDVPKDRHGNYIFPVDIDSWTVLDLGTVIWDRPAFHNQRYIYPVGYCVKKWYRSMVDPHSDTQYTCKILDGGDEPIFQLEADDNPGEVWRGPTPTTVWTIAVRRAFAIRNMDYGHNPVGPDFFGLRKNTIAKMIQDLPNADQCRNYVWQHFEIINNSVSGKGKPLRRSNTRVSTSSSRSSTSSVSNVSEPMSTPVPHPQNSSSTPLHGQQQAPSPSLKDEPMTDATP